MLTLTVDQKKFDSPWQCMERVGELKSVPKMIGRLNKKGLLKNKEYTKTLEFHKKFWPHWHVLVESRFIPHAELVKAWRHGHCYISKHDFADVTHAINYATKYIVKTDEESSDEEKQFAFPEWCLDYKGNIRRFETSRGLCPTRKIKNRSKYDDDKIEKRVRLTKTNRQKLSSCGMNSTVLVDREKETVLTNARTGKSFPVVELGSWFCATLGVPFQKRFLYLSQTEIRAMLFRHRAIERAMQEYVAVDQCPVEFAARVQRLTVYRSLKLGPFRGLIDSHSQAQPLAQ